MGTRGPVVGGCPVLAAIEAFRAEAIRQCPGDPAGQDWYLGAAVRSWLAGRRHYADDRLAEAA